MDDNGALVRKLLRQQAAIAAFGTFALRSTDLQTVLNEAARVCADGLDVPFTKICRYRADENDLIIQAGYGWNKGVIGYVVPHPDHRTPQGKAFITGKPLICNVLLNEDGFNLPPFYADHGIVSTIDVVIGGNDRRYGVLEMDSDSPQDYDQHDIDFLTGFANVLAEAVATYERIELLRTTIDSMARLVREKDQLLDQKQVMADELHHRVRNNLQLVGGMLSKQLKNTTDTAGRRGLAAVNRRVFTLSQVYDQLLGTEMTRSIDFHAYLEALCANLAELQAPADGSVKLHYDGDPLKLDLDVVTTLGIIAAELVTNSFEHAFCGRGGQITVSLKCHASDGTASMTIEDNGVGFKPKAFSKRHGVGLVHRLCEQIRGEAKADTSEGTRWKICIPVGAEEDEPQSAASVA